MSLALIFLDHRESDVLGRDGNLCRDLRRTLSIRDDGAVFTRTFHQIKRH